ncbi:MAG: hypothetical protein JST40_13405 [Armatimonadetes bacterium]|nr:hypothetical protein [Armatimonadota bacterium]
MNLNEYVAKTKREIFEALSAGLEPSLGTYDAAILKEVRSKGSPRMGVTVYSPDSLTHEFIYTDGPGSSVILPVTIPAPERIVFLPVPRWVVENIWQGNVDGSFQFESDAIKLLKEFERELEPQNNPKWFGPRASTRRE